MLFELLPSIAAKAADVLLLHSLFLPLVPWIPLMPGC